MHVLEVDAGRVGHSGLAASRDEKLIIADLGASIKNYFFRLSVDALDAVTKLVVDIVVVEELGRAHQQIVYVCSADTLRQDSSVIRESLLVRQHHDLASEVRLTKCLGAIQAGCSATNDEHASLVRRISLGHVGDLLLLKLGGDTHVMLAILRHDVVLGHAVDTGVQLDRTCHNAEASSVPRAKHLVVKHYTVDKRSSEVRAISAYSIQLTIVAHD